MNQRKMKRCPAPRKSKSASGGLTLVELLMAAAMSVVVAVAVLSAVSRGADIWRRAAGTDSLSEVVFFFDRFTEDIRNCQVFPEIGFWGNEKSMGFPSLVSGRNFFRPVPGRVTYAYGGGSFTRTETDYSGMYTGEDEKKVVLNGVLDAGFSYYAYDEITDEFIWQDEVEEGILPLAARVEIKMTDGKNERLYHKTVTIPVGGK